MSFASELVGSLKRKEEWVSEIQPRKNRCCNHSLTNEKVEQVKEEILINKLSLMALPKNCKMKVLNYSERDLFTIKQVSKAFKEIVEKDMPILWMEEVKKDLLISLISIDYSLKASQQWNSLCEKVIKKVRATLNLRINYSSFFNKQSMDLEKKQILLPQDLKRFTKWCEAVKITIDFNNLKFGCFLYSSRKLSSYITELEKNFDQNENCLESEVEVARKIQEWLNQNPDVKVNLPISKKSESNPENEPLVIDANLLQNAFIQDDFLGDINLFGTNLQDFN